MKWIESPLMLILFLVACLGLPGTKQANRLIKLASSEVNLGGFSSEECVSSCSGHGLCSSSASCLCEPGWMGQDCSLGVPCPSNCTGNGVCKAGSCFCFKGFTTYDCSIPTCPGETNGVPCSGHGFCNSGLCACDNGWQAKDCGIVQECPYECVHGVCKEAQCVCEEGYWGKSCDDTDYCLTSCSGHGTCTDHKCFCNSGYQGLTCAEVAECPRSCLENLGHGHCVDGNCVCNLGWTGISCDQDCCVDEMECTLGQAVCVRPPCHCRNDCNQHGICHHGVCLCRRGWVGEDCSLGLCKNNCSSQGRCDYVNRKCQCDEGFSGDDCSEESCPNDCSGHGLCADNSFGKKECMCAAGWQTTKDDDTKPCSAVKACPKVAGQVCAGNGVCKVGFCQCAPGFMSDDCTDLDPAGATGDPCPQACSGNGVCNEQMKMCECDLMWEGAACNVKKECRNRCSGHGICKNSECMCQPLWSAKSDCSEGSCPHKCSGHGSCSEGLCDCAPPFHGTGCEKQMCPNRCSGHGNCDSKTGLCTCLGEYGSADCSIIPCPGDCNRNGNCDASVGKCYCFSGWGGSSCDKPTSCPHDCYDRGSCVGGKCFCHKNFTGADCKVITRPPPPPGSFFIPAIALMQQWPRSSAPPPGPVNVRDVQKDLFRRTFGDLSWQSEWHKVTTNATAAKLLRSCFETVVDSASGQTLNFDEEKQAAFKSLFGAEADTYQHRITASSYLTEAFHVYYGSTREYDSEEQTGEAAARTQLPPKPPPKVPQPRGMKQERGGQQARGTRPPPGVESGGVESGGVEREKDLTFGWADLRDNFQKLWNKEGQKFMERGLVGSVWEGEMQGLFETAFGMTYKDIWADIWSNAERQLRLKTEFGFKRGSPGREEASKKAADSGVETGKAVLSTTQQQHNQDTRHSEHSAQLTELAQLPHTTTKPSYQKPWSSGLRAETEFEFSGGGVRQGAQRQLRATATGSKEHPPRLHQQSDPDDSSSESTSRFVDTADSSVTSDTDSNSDSNSASFSSTSQSRTVESKEVEPAQDEK